MGCEEGVVTEDRKEALKHLEDCLSYPPRFQIKFEYYNSEKPSTEVTITFNGISYSGNSPTVIITLKRPGWFIMALHVIITNHIHRFLFLHWFISTWDFI